MSHSKPSGPKARRTGIMEYFNEENTMGYDDCELDLMNSDLENRMSDYDSNSFGYNDILKREAEKVLRDWD